MPSRNPCTQSDKERKCEEDRRESEGQPRRPAVHSGQHGGVQCLCQLALRRLHHRRGNRSQTSARGGNIVHRDHRHGPGIMFQASVDALGLSAAKGPRVRDGMFHGGRPVLSSLGLQLCLSFNTYFSPFWLVGCAIISGTISEVGDCTVENPCVFCLSRFPVARRWSPSLTRRACVPVLAVSS